MPDLDWSNVYADAANDPTLDRDCEEGADCTDSDCPLIHPLTRAEVKEIDEDDLRKEERS